VDVADLFRRTGRYVDRILHGAKSADLPVQLPTKFELIVNVKIAKALGLDIPAAILLRADHVIDEERSSKVFPLCALDDARPEALKLLCATNGSNATHPRRP
jgi:hypothetical protein